MYTSSTCPEVLGLKTSTKVEACTQVEDFLKELKPSG